MNIYFEGLIYHTLRPDNKHLLNHNKNVSPIFKSLYIFDLGYHFVDVDCSHVFPGAGREHSALVAFTNLFAHSDDRMGALFIPLSLRMSLLHSGPMALTVISFTVT